MERLFSLQRNQGGQCPRNSQSVKPTKAATRSPPARSTPCRLRVMISCSVKSHGCKDGLGQ
ncbi:hypothetical protein [Spirosoma lituiforme]